MSVNSNSSNRFVQLLSVAVLLLCCSFSTGAEEFLDLMWDDLQPRLNPLDENRRDANAGEPPISHTMGMLQQPGVVVPELDGKRIRIPAFVVALDGDREALTEMLLVPYFGACIHMPPPPPNQIIYIEQPDGVKIDKLDLYRPVWVTGTLRTEALEHELAQVGYRMEIEKMVEYNPRAASKQKRRNQ